MLERMAETRIPFDLKQPDLDSARQIVFERLRRDQQYKQFDNTGDGFAPFVEYCGANEPERRNGRRILVFLAREIFWELVVAGILAPGMDSWNLDLPWFHITEYGRRVLMSSEPQPYDATGYLARLRDRVIAADETVMAYVAESLETFRKGNRVASAITLGIAAERVFLLICDSLAAALSEPSEKAAFAKIRDRFPMKPKLDWVHKKIQQIQNQAPAGFPDNATIMLVAIYDLMRCQRNELGHPRETPPNIDREEAFVNLQIFPRYYQAAEQVISFFASTSV